MPTNPIIPPTRGQTIARVASRYADAVILAIGVVLGAALTILGGAVL